MAVLTGWERNGADRSSTCPAAVPGVACFSVGRAEITTLLERASSEVHVCNNANWLVHYYYANGRERDAVELAERACELTGYREPQLLQTLAIAYREAGREEEEAEVLRRGGL